MLLLISGFILVLAWIGFSIYHNLATSTVSTAVGSQLRPIPGSFDMTTINNLKNRKNISPDYNNLETQISTESANPTPVPTVIIPTPTVATSSGQTATEGATP